MRRLRIIGMLLVPVLLASVKLQFSVAFQFHRNEPRQEQYIEVLPRKLTNNKKNSLLETYIIEAFNRDFVVELEPLNSFLTTNFHILKLKEGTSSSRSKFQPGTSYKQCLYKGKLRGDPQSAVSLSTCNGLMGLIRACDCTYKIEPDGNSTEIHRLYKMGNVTTNTCDQNDAVHVGDLDRRRHKRSVSQEWNMEMLIVADSKMKRYHGENLEMYILTLLASVALIFKDPSIGNNINISVNKLIVMEEEQDAGIIFASASKTLKNFCRWQNQQNDPTNPLGTHDTAILLTREDLCRQSKTCDTLGLAQSGMVCDRSSSCAVVEDNGLSAAFTIAHELGHILGIPHDDDVKCARFQEQNQRLHIMARMLDYHSHPWSWSECSRHYVTTFLDAGYGSCLLNSSSKNKLTLFPYASTPPGELYDMDYQCELVFGQGSKICPYMPVCKRLWCTMEDVLQGGCRTQHMPWADGTKCAPDKSCHQGECILDPITTGPPRDGQWGTWRDFGPCSRSCGGGIRRSIRECDNPRPTNGGRYCVGDRIRYQSCNTQECLPGSTDFREEQCSSFNGKTFGFAGIKEDVKWIPHFSGIVKESCKLYCKASGTAAFFLLKEKVIDGTTCGPDTFDICVNGQCMAAGCDHVLDSKQVTDACGVCGGSGSTCRIIHGSYVNVQYGYNDVVTVPAGASNIEILQFGHDNSKDDNYLALMDSNSTYILNGDFMISMFPKTLHYAGSVLEYTGSDTIVEKINASKQLQKNLYVQVLTVGSLHSPSVSFNYTISLNDHMFYYWRLEESWSPCNSICQGEQYRKAVCISKADGRIVSDEHCREKERPAHSARVCNPECTLRWHKSYATPCSSTCGEGIILNTVKCIQYYNSGSIVEMPDLLCVHLASRPDKFEPCVGLCNNTEWKFDEWSECSKTCGGGIQVRNALCIGDGVVQLPNSECENLTKITERSCHETECPEWVVGDWNECSTSCGPGLRYRSYWCMLKEEIVSTDLCNSSIPSHIEKCLLSPCFVWYAGPWDMCSVTCGTGQMKREIRCHSIEEKIVSSHFCDVTRKPPSVKQCAQTACENPAQTSEENANNSIGRTSLLEPSIVKDDIGFQRNFEEKARWKTSTWSPCSVTCGNGTMRRQVLCQNFSNGHTLTEENCDGSGRPVDSVSCQEKFCGNWVNGLWSECSSSCGVGKQKRNVVCLLPDLTEIQETFCDANLKPVKEQSCQKVKCPYLFPGFHPNLKAIHNSVESSYMWRTGSWGKCSRPCGGGLRRRQVACYDETGQNSTYCEPKRRPTDTTTCNIETCPHWKTHPWSECSVTCGVGLQTRHVVCVNHKNSLVPHIRCPIPVPLKEKKCKNNCLHWTWSPWSECSSSCGRGIQKRVAKCYRGKKIVKDDYCALISKPMPQTRQCKGIACRFRWRKKSWSKCSTSCGKGHKQRIVYCSNGNDAIVPDIFCNQYNKPRMKRRCHQHNCTFTWKAGHWSECSKTCGMGIRKRSVSCHKVNIFKWIDSNPVPKPNDIGSPWCNEIDKPSELKNCTHGNCNGPIWKSEDWLPCSVRCGLGHQRRKVYCFNAQGKRLANKRCHRKLRPQRRRKCQMRPCSAISCSDYVKRANITHDGEQEIFLRGKYIKIYCSGMSTVNPKEYITLPRGESDNYSEIYNKRLLIPDSCPFRGTRYDSCDCVSDDSIGSGLTMFHRVAINISSLQVFTQDFTYSVTHTGEPVPYGESGDCYSMSTCPQGRFSLSLLGTGFRVSTKTKWTTQGNYASNKIRWLEAGQVIQGKCGGYCGRCRPDASTGLLLEVAPP